MSLWPRRCVISAVAAGALCAAAEPMLVTLPAAPAHGEPVALELRDSQPVFLPGVRFTRAGNRFTVDLEQPGSEFGPFPPSLGSMPLPLGELVPGRYAVQARLHDMSRPGEPPRIASLEFGVAAPREPGVYAVPARPFALQPLDVFVSSAVYFDPASVKVSAAPGLVRVDFDHLPGVAPPAAAPGMTTLHAVRLPGLARGDYRLEAWSRPFGGGAPQRYFTAQLRVRAETEVVEYYHEALDHYFLAAAPQDIAQLDAGAYGGWKRTGQGFAAWREARDAPAGAAAVCRFYNPVDRSHLHTADVRECAQLRELERIERAILGARPFTGWAYEGVDFHAVAPLAGECPAGTVPVYRAYNGRAEQRDAAWRLTTNARARHAMAGWDDHGVAFCAAA